MFSTVAAPLLLLIVLEPGTSQVRTKAHIHVIGEYIPIGHTHSIIMLTGSGRIGPLYSTCSCFLEIIVISGSSILPTPSVGNKQGDNY